MAEKESTEEKQSMAVLVVGADGNAQLVQLDKVVAVIGELEGGHLVRTTAATTTVQAGHIRLLHAGHQFCSIGGLFFLVIIKVDQLEAIGRWTALSTVIASSPDFRPLSIDLSIFF
ncbi:hypothetical protein TYRP_019704 [Tyrophagus putrescentiae]|nr:hypothetical protein TYRP_019704 [Tyrophagus putrescentiae]